MKYLVRGLIAFILLLTSPFLLAANVSTPKNARGSQTGHLKVTWRWNKVSGAARYACYVDGQFFKMTTGLNCVTTKMWVGTHSFDVQALSSSGRYSHKSNTAKVNVKRTFTKKPSSPPPSPGKLIDNATYSQPRWSKPGYQLTFSDEFNNQKNINRTRWNTKLRWDGDHNGSRFEYRVINGEHQFYVNTNSRYSKGKSDKILDSQHKDILRYHNPFQFTRNSLKIQAIRNYQKNRNSRRTFGNLTEIFRQQPFLSGVLASYDKFSQRYGYFEARIKVPHHLGAFPAFWLHHQTREGNFTDRGQNTRKTEIDIMENLGHNPKTFFTSFHTFDGVRKGYGGKGSFLKPRNFNGSYAYGSANNVVQNGQNFSSKFHTYAVQWDPGKIIWYLDGKPIKILRDGRIGHEKLYVILNLAIGGNWTNFPTSAGGIVGNGRGPFPNSNDLRNFKNPSLEIDYIRAYKRK